MTNSLEQAARSMAGNWRSFQDFAWRCPGAFDIPEEWCLVYTRHRDSGLTDQSNAAAIDEALSPYLDGGDLLAEHHFHWAVGWLDGYGIRVYRAGHITPAFRTWHGLAERMARDGLLNEADHAARQHEATLENIASVGWRLKERHRLLEGWEQRVHEWLWDHRDSALEDRDDQGGCPRQDQIEEALRAIGLIEGFLPAMPSWQR